MDLCIYKCLHVSISNQSVKVLTDPYVVVCFSTTSQKWEPRAVAVNMNYRSGSLNKAYYVSLKFISKTLVVWKSAYDISTMYLSLCFLFKI